MKGYKGMDQFMRCKGFQYEVGVKYRVYGEVELCKNGFHFCEVLQDVFEFYERDDRNRFFEVEASGKLESDGTKTAAEEIAIIREIGEIEVNRAFYGNVNGDGYGDGDGDGDGYGYGDGDGYGYGDGDGDGDGYGYGNGDGYGDGYGYGYGYGDGDGYGKGYGKGNGDGYGYGKNIQKVLILI